MFRAKYSTTECTENKGNCKSDDQGLNEVKHLFYKMKFSYFALPFISKCRGHELIKTEEEVIEEKRQEN